MELCGHPAGDKANRTWARCLPGVPHRLGTAGCSPRAAEALAQSEIDEVDQIASLGRAFFERVPSCDAATVAEIGRFIGGWPGNPEMTMVGSAVEVIAAVDRVMIDVKVEHDDATGLRHRDHAFAGLSIADAVRLHDALADAITAAMNSDPRQASLWSRRSER